MYLLYIDDSGSCDLKKDEICMKNGGTNSRYFVLGSILLKAHELNKNSKNFDFIKSSCLGSELKEVKHSVKSSFLQCISECRKESADIFCYKSTIATHIANMDCNVFISYQDKYMTYKKGIVTSKNDVYRLSFEYLLKSVDTFMFNNKIKEDTIVFIDKKDGGPDKDILIYKSYKQALQNKKIFKAFDNTIFCPNINIVYSQFTDGIQYADFIAGSVWNFLESRDDTNKQNELRKITSIYSDKVYRHNGKMLGYVACNEKLQ